MRCAMHEAPVGLTSLVDHSRTGLGKYEEGKEDPSKVGVPWKYLYLLGEAREARSALAFTDLR